MIPGGALLQVPPECEWEWGGLTEQPAASVMECTTSSVGPDDEYELAMVVGTGLEIFMLAAIMVGTWRRR